MGIRTKERFNNLFDEGDISAEDVSIFFRSARAFYTRTTEYSLKNLPVNDEFLRCVSFASFYKRESSTLSQLEHIVQR